VKRNSFVQLIFVPLSWFHFFVEVWIVKLHSLNPAPRGTVNHPHRHGDNLSSFISCAPQSSGGSALLNRRLEFHKRHQLFICTHNETLSVVAMRVSNPDRSPVGIKG
jgi:hypothetical protein